MDGLESSSRCGGARRRRDPPDLGFHRGSRRDHAQVLARAGRTHDRRIRLAPGRCWISVTTRPAANRRTVRRGHRRAGSDGPLRAVGVVVRNPRGRSSTTGRPRLDRLPRQATGRGGIDGARAAHGREAAWVVSADVDVARYATGTGDRRVIAAGAERWLVR